MVSSIRLLSSHYSFISSIRFSAKKTLYLNMDTGKEQLVRDSNADDPNSISIHDRVKVITAIRQMDHYVKHIISHPAVNTKTRERCRNEFRMCAEWASRGLCLPDGYPVDKEGLDFNGGSSSKDGIVFMMNICPLACQMCEEVGKFHQCAGKRHPWAEASFENGRLHSFLDARRNGDAWKTYEPIFVSYPDSTREEGKDDPYVIVLQNFLSLEEADRLQSLGSTIGWTPSVLCRNNDACNNDKSHQQLMERIASLVNTTTHHLEPMEMFQFIPGDQPSKPQHNFEVNSLWKPSGPRVLSLFIFLTDEADTEGKGRGGLGFPYLDWLFIRPKKGMAILYPNVMNDDVYEMDPLLSYEHFPVREGEDTSYGATVHVRLYNWTDANVRGCA